MGLQSADLSELALTVLAEWVQHLTPHGSKKSTSTVGMAHGGNSKGPATHDLCRFTEMVARLVENCQFDAEDPQSYSSHEQIARLLSDLCTYNAAGLSLMPSKELSGL